MRFTAAVEALTLEEVRAEMDRLVVKRNSRGDFHPAEYWRWKELGRLEASLLGLDGRTALGRTA